MLFMIHGCVYMIRVSEWVSPGESWAGGPPNPLVRLKRRWGRHIIDITCSLNNKKYNWTIQTLTQNPPKIIKTSKVTNISQEFKLLYKLKQA